MRDLRNIRLVAVAIAAMAASVALAVTNAGAAAAPADPASRLQCDSSTIELATVTHGGFRTVNSATPQQLADRWAANERPDRRFGALTRKTAYQSDNRADVVYEHEGRPVAALTFEHHPATGWLLVTMANCLTVGGPR
jgi:hypothetical protein